MVDIANRPTSSKDFDIPATAQAKTVTIVAGRVPTQDLANHVRDMLIAEGVPARDVSCFWLNPPGQHNLTPIGGDEIADDAAKPATSGALAGVAGGGVIGAVAGVAGVAAVGVDPALAVAVAAGIGAHVGGLVGALSNMKGAQGESDADESDTAQAELGKPAPSDAKAEAAEELPGPRHAGTMIAVKVDASNNARVTALLTRAGVEDIEHTEGLWRNGEWIDFDPRDQTYKG